MSRFELQIEIPCVLGRGKVDIQLKEEEMDDATSIVRQLGS